MSFETPDERDAMAEERYRRWNRMPSQYESGEVPQMIHHCGDCVKINTNECPAGDGIPCDTEACEEFVDTADTKEKDNG
jgi:hypothetical protein